MLPLEVILKAMIIALAVRQTDTDRLVPTYNTQCIDTN